MSESKPKTLRLIDDLEHFVNELLETHQLIHEQIKERIQGIEDTEELTKVMKGIADSTRIIAQAIKLVRQASSEEKQEDTSDDWLNKLKK